MLLKRSKNSVPNDTALANKGTANTMDKEASKRINIGNGGRIEVRVENGLDSCTEAKLAVVTVSSQAAVKKANGIPLITKDAYGGYRSGLVKQLRIGNLKYNFAN